MLLLLALTPGIPEYLSGSSRLVALPYFPGGTFGTLLFVGLNLGLYGPGVLLVRETWVRGGGGWARLLLLGTAYALLEEGTALSTLFNPSNAVVEGIPGYGRLFGVNWIWLVGIVGYHIVLSVGIPIVLLGLALPETRGRPWLSTSQIGWAGFVFALDIVLLAMIANRWREDLPWMVGAAVAAASIWYASGRLTSRALEPREPHPTTRPWKLAALGLALFPSLILLPALGGSARWPSGVTVVLELAAGAALFAAVRQKIGRDHHDRELVALALGATVPIAVWGLLTQLGLPVVLGVDLLYILFFRFLFRRYPAMANAGVPVPS